MSYWVGRLIDSGIWLDISAARFWQRILELMIRKDHPAAGGVAMLDFFRIDRKVAYLLLVTSLAMASCVLKADRKSDSLNTSDGIEDISSPTTNGLDSNSTTNVQPPPGSGRVRVDRNCGGMFYAVYRTLDGVPYNRPGDVVYFDEVSCLTASEDEVIDELIWPSVCQELPEEIGDRPTNEALAKLVAACRAVSN
jgi:hypothetical protein